MLCAMQIVSPTILPFTVERENLLLDATSSVQQGHTHSNAYFRISDVKSSQKEHTLWVTLVINRQSFKHGAGRVTYKQVNIGNLSAATHACGYQAVAGSSRVLAALLDGEFWLQPSRYMCALSGSHYHSQGSNRSMRVLGCHPIGAVVGSVLDAHL